MTGELSMAASKASDKSSSYRYVRTDEAPRMAAPASQVGVIGWVRSNLFSSRLNTAISILSLLFVAWALPPILNWAFFNAIWTGENREACIVEGAGACWAFVNAKFQQFIYGRYPIDERWRVNIVFALSIIGLIPLLIPTVKYKRENAIFMLGVFPFLSVVLLTGGNSSLGSFLIAGFFTSGVVAFIIDFVIFFGVIAGLAALIAIGSEKDPLPSIKTVAIAGLVFAGICVFLAVDFGLRPVPTDLWGGLLVTLIVAVAGIVASFPIGVVLALGRRSKLPLVRFFSIVFIEVWRGVPLITVLFMSSVMLPLFLPDGVNFDKLLRALIGVALFAAAYMAEVVRGGLQALPKGQYEAGAAMGLTYWQSMRLIILPQALKISIPGIMNTFIGLFKDTSLVLIIGLFDLLGIIQFNFTDSNWASPQTPATGFIFASLVFFVFCFGMSRYSIYMEERLNTGHKR